MTDPDLRPVEEPPLPRARWKRSALWLALEAVLIGASVFLGLLGQQWFEERQHREEAKDALRRFRMELTINKAEVEKKFAYHSEIHRTLRPYVRADAKARGTMSPGKLDDLQPPFFERTAWELALGTQSLAYLDNDLAYVLSRIYFFQTMADTLGGHVMSTMYLQTTESEAFLRALDLYYGDMVGIEPGLLEMYGVALKAIDETLAE